MKTRAQKGIADEPEPTTNHSADNPTGLAITRGTESIPIERSVLRSPSLTRGATGPRTPAGKDRSKQNALKHGIFSKVLLLKDESRAEFDALLKGLREDLQPEGILEETLVEKLAALLWRHRRLLIAEVAEIGKSVRFLDWDEENHQTEQAHEISEYSIEYEGGLTRRIANPKVLQRCLELLRELRDGIEADGFDSNWDSSILTKLYGEDSSEKWQWTLDASYRTWLKLAEADLSDEERQAKGVSPPKQCITNFLAELDKEIKQLERYRKTRAAVESERMKVEALRRSVPEGPQLDRLLKYEASLERNFDRTLSQLERLQRMRLGQPVPPPIDVNLSAS